MTFNFVRLLYIARPAQLGCPDIGGDASWHEVRAPLLEQGRPR